MKKYFGKIILSSLFLLLLSITQTEATAFQVQQGNTTLTVKLYLPKGYEFIPQAPHSIACQTANPDIVEIPEPSPKLSGNTFKITFKTKPGHAILTLKADIYYCQKSSKMCFQDKPETQITLDIGPQGSSIILYHWNITPKESL